MNTYYRGYVIHEDIRSICYTIYGRRPHRVELAARSTALAAMRWVDLDTRRADARAQFRPPSTAVWQPAQ